MKTSRDIFTTLAGVAAALAFSACSNHQEPQPAPPTPTPTPTPETKFDKERVVALMKKQLETVDAIHLSVAFGDLARARESANWLAENAMVGEVPQSWTASVASIQTHSTKVAGGKKLGDIGESLGAVLAACGGCHENLGITVAAAKEAPRAGDSLSAKMLQHTSAMTKLEHGLVLPNATMWKEGAQLIGAGSFDLDSDPPTEIDSKEADALSVELKELGKRAEASTTLAEQGRIYGEMMARCNACHERSRSDGTGQ